MIFRCFSQYMVVPHVASKCCTWDFDGVSFFLSLILAAPWLFQHLKLDVSCLRAICLTVMQQCISILIVWNIFYIHVRYFYTIGETTPDIMKKIGLSICNCVRLFCLVGWALQTLFIFYFFYWSVGYIDRIISIFCWNATQ